MATESVPYSGEMLPRITELVERADAKPTLGPPMLGPIRPKLVERIMPVTFENTVELYQGYWDFDPLGKKMPELLGMLSAHLDRATIRHCMESVRWGLRLRLADALKDAYSRKCEGEYCLSNDSTRAEPCNQEIEASADPEVVLCKKCREEEA